MFEIPDFVRRILVHSRVHRIQNNNIVIYYIHTYITYTDLYKSRISYFLVPTLPPRTTSLTKKPKTKNQKQNLKLLLLSFVFTYLSLIYKSQWNELTFEYSSSKKKMSFTTPFHLDSLYCQEPHFNEENYETFDEYEPLFVLNQHFDQENEDGLSSLLLKEEISVVCDDLEKNSFLVEARRDAVEWILKVVGFYSFSSLTAVLAVNYFDRFVKRFEFQTGKLWMIQLVSVTCLSLAAKMEEVDVPLLLDLQVGPFLIFCLICWSVWINVDV